MTDFGACPCDGGQVVEELNFEDLTYDEPSLEDEARKERAALTDFDVMSVAMIFSPLLLWAPGPIRMLTDIQLCMSVRSSFSGWLEAYDLLALISDLTFRSASRLCF